MEFSHFCEIRSLAPFCIEIILLQHLLSLFTFEPLLNAVAYKQRAVEPLICQTFKHFTLLEGNISQNCLKYFSQVLWGISLICVKYFLQEQEVVSEALWIGYLAWSPASGLSSQLQTSLIIRNQEVQIWQMYLQILVKIYFCISVFLSRHQMIKFHKGPSDSKVIIFGQHS